MRGVENTGQSGVEKTKNDVVERTISCAGHGKKEQLGNSLTTQTAPEPNT